MTGLAIADPVIFLLGQKATAKTNTAILRLRLRMTAVPRTAVAYCGRMTAVIGLRPFAIDVDGER
jgi:hypothetical protein